MLCVGGPSARRLRARRAQCQPKGEKPMRSRLIAVPIAALVLAGAVLAIWASPASAGDDDQPHKVAVGSVRLSGAQEVPAADPDGFGRFTYVAAGDKLCYILTAFNVDPPLAAHIHVGAAGVNGPI